MEDVSSLLLAYKYVILFPLVMTGGPIVTVIAASFASFGILNVYAVYVVAVLGTVTGDTLWYWIGRVGRSTFIPRYGHYFGITEEKVRYAEEHYQNHLGKTLFFGKITEAAVVVVLLAAGASRVNFKKFLKSVVLIEIFKILAFTLLGFYLGKYYILIKQYLNTWSAIGFAAIFVGGLAYWFFVRKKKI